jgi:hypothetical protein
MTSLKVLPWYFNEGRDVNHENIKFTSPNLSKYRNQHKTLFMFSRIKCDKEILVTKETNFI